MEEPLCRTQQTIKYEPVPINFGSKPESPKVGKMSSGTMPRKNCRRRSFGKSPTNLRQLYCPDNFEAVGKERKCFYSYAHEDPRAEGRPDPLGCAIGISSGHCRLVGPVVAMAQAVPAQILL